MKIETLQTNNDKIFSLAYQPTPRPESVYILNENSRVPKNESCCVSW